MDMYCLVCLFIYIHILLPSFHPSFPIPFSSLIECLDILVCPEWSCIKPEIVKSCSLGSPHPSHAYLNLDNKSWDTLLIGLKLLLLDSHTVSLTKLKPLLMLKRSLIQRSQQKARDHYPPSK